MTDITYPTLHATHFDYDADGRKIDMTDATGTTSWYYGYDGVHLSQLANPQGTLTYVYNGLGLRVGKADSTGTYSYFCDGASPGSPVLSDGHAVYTPGLSESRGDTSTFEATRS